MNKIGKDRFPAGPNLYKTAESYDSIGCWISKISTVIINGICGKKPQTFFWWPNFCDNLPVHSCNERFLVKRPEASKAIFDIQPRSKERREYLSLVSKKKKNHDLYQVEKPSLHSHRGIAFVSPHPSQTPSMSHEKRGKKKKGWSSRTFPAP